MSVNGQIIDSRRLSWQAWLALAYTLILYPVGWGNFSRLHPGLLAVHAHGTRSGFYSFWGTVFVIEWVGFFLCLLALRAEGRPAKEIGLFSSRLRIYLLLFVIAIIGLSAVFVALGFHWLRSPSANPFSLQSFTSTAERFFWLVMAPTAGICEEAMFRGFAITYLRKLLRSTWLAVFLSTFTFAYMHGGFSHGVASFAILFALGLIFSGIYLWRRSLLPGMFLHFLFDAVATLY